MAEIKAEEVRDYLKRIEGQIITLDRLRREFNILPGTKSFNLIRNYMWRFDKEGVVKVNRRGEYKVIVPIEPIKWSLDGADTEGLLDFKFPRSYIDDSTFELEDKVEVFEGDLILITGVSNYWKSGMAYSILGMNLDLMPSVLMGNEIATSKLELAPKLKRRFRRMDWAKWTDSEGKPRFDILPVGADYEEYIRPNYLNVVDWITLPGEYWMIDSVLKTMKDRLDKGVLVAVLQKKKNVDDPEGGERAKRHADVELKIDPFGQDESLLTIGKVKAPKGRITGRMWAFGVTDYGANLIDIREVVRCTTCYGKGYVGRGDNYKRCQTCRGLKYINK